MTGWTLLLLWIGQWRITSLLTLTARAAFFMLPTATAGVHPGLFFFATLVLVGALACCIPCPDQFDRAVGLLLLYLLGCICAPIFLSLRG